MSENRNWMERFNVKSDVHIDTIDRLEIHVGVNYYDGNYNIYVAKVTESGFCKSFYALPTAIWKKLLPYINKFTEEVSRIELEDRKAKILEEIEKLKQLGVDISKLVK